MDEVIEFDQMIQRGCGLDVHRSVITATIKGSGIEQETRSFEAYTEDLQQMCQWLLAHQVDTVAMESTGLSMHIEGKSSFSF